MEEGGGEEERDRDGLGQDWEASVKWLVSMANRVKIPCIRIWAPFREITLLWVHPTKLPISILNLWGWGATKGQTLINNVTFALVSNFQLLRSCRTLLLHLESPTLCSDWLNFMHMSRLRLGSSPLGSLPLLTKSGWGLPLVPYTVPITSTSESWPCF